jgi:hypothetical protein
MLLLALVLLGVACGQTIPAVYYVGVSLPFAALG